MKENIREIKFNENWYLIDELDDIDEEEFLYKIGGYYSSNKVNPQYDPTNKYKGVIVIPNTEFNNKLPKEVKEFMFYHELGHCQDGGLPDNQVEYDNDSLEFEKVADRFAATIIGKQKALDVMKEIYTIFKVHLEYVSGYDTLKFDNDMKERINFIEKMSVG